VEITEATVWALTSLRDSVRLRVDKMRLAPGMAACFVNDGT
jgi:hypothetical protein